MPATLRMPLLAVLLMTAMSGCDVSVGHCDRNDAGRCVFGADEPPEFGSDGGQVDSGAADASVVDAALALDSASPSAADAGTLVDASGDDASVAPQMTIEDFCRELNRVGFGWADRLDECCISPAERVSATAADILNAVGAYSDTAVGGCIAFYEGLVAQKAVTFSPGRATACVDAFTAAYPPPPACSPSGVDLQAVRSMVGHGAPQLAQIQACRETLPGIVRRDAACTRNFECAVGLTCLPLFTAQGGSTCRPPSQVGERCETAAHCAGGLTCVGSTTFGRTCRPVTELVEIGRCESSQECVPGRVCDQGMCMLAVLGTDVICRQ